MDLGNPPGCLSEGVSGALLARLVPFVLTAPQANNYLPTPAGCFSSSVYLAVGACANAADTAIASALATARVATGFSHSNAMKAATMSQAIIT